MIKTDLLQALDNDYEAQLLNEFYNQENESKKEKLQKIKDKYKQNKLQLSKKRIYEKCFNL